MKDTSSGHGLAARKRDAAANEEGEAWEGSSTWLTLVAVIYIVFAEGSSSSSAVSTVTLWTENTSRWSWYASSPAPLSHSSVPSLHRSCDSGGTGHPDVMVQPSKELGPSFEHASVSDAIVLLVMVCLLAL